MPNQSGRNIAVNYKAESSFGILPGATGGKVFRPNSGNLSLSKEAIRSNENRRDGMTTRGRHGGRSVGGQYSCDLSVGSYDDWIEAVFRGTFEPAVTITQATPAMSSATLAITSNTITASAGSWITAGLRAGDVISFVSGVDAGSTIVNGRIGGVTATTITITTMDLVPQVGPIATWSLRRHKKLVQGVVPRSFTIEEHEYDIDASEVFKGNRVSQMQLQMQPNGMVTLTFTLVGRDMEVMTGASAPYFTDPTETISIGLTAVEAKIRMSGGTLDISSLDLTINLNAAGHPVVGSVLTPDVFTNLATVEGSITALKADVTRVEQFLAETQQNLSLIMEELAPGALSGFCAFYLPNLTLASATKSDVGSDGGRTQTFQLMVGADLRGGAFDRTMIKYLTSAT